MELLPDLVPSRARVVFCGVAGADASTLRDHYYETPGNAFWALLHQSGIVPRRLGPSDDVSLAEHGLGLTDLAARRTPDGTTYAVDALEDKVRAWEPEWLAFTSKTVAAVVARHRGERRPGLGVAPWSLGGASVFVLPGSSGANHRKDYDGRVGRLTWWQDLAALCD